MDNQLPYSQDAEIAVLGGVFNDPERIYEIKEMLTSDCFYEQRHQVIFQAFIDLMNQHQVIDLLTVKDYLTDKNKLEQVGGFEYLSMLNGAVSIASNLGAYARIVYDKYMIRQTISTGSKMINYAKEHDEANMVVDYAQKAVVELSQLTQSGEFLDWGQSLDAWHEDMIKLINDNKSLTGLSTNYKTLDDHTNGFHGGELIILAARPSMGKTAFSLNLMANMAKSSNNNRPHIAFYSLEMPASQLITRFVSIDSGVNIAKLRSGDLNADEVAFVEQSKKNLHSYNFHIDETPGLKINELKSKARKLKLEHGLDAIFIDYLQLITTDNPNVGRVQEVSYISRELKAIAKELDVPVIALSQLSREVERRQNKKPQMSDIRDSGAIEQDADIIMMLYRPEYYQDDEFNHAEYQGQTIVSIEKNRNGRTGDINFSFISETNQFIITNTQY